MDIEKQTIGSRNRNITVTASMILWCLDIIGHIFSMWGYFSVFFEFYLVGWMFRGIV